MEYKTLVLRGDLETAAQVLETIPQDQYNGIAKFLEAKGMPEEALEVATDTGESWVVRGVVRSIEPCQVSGGQGHARGGVLDVATDTSRAWVVRFGIPTLGVGMEPRGHAKGRANARSDGVAMWGLGLMKGGDRAWEGRQCRDA